jgi:hypothetical protein
VFGNYSYQSNYGDGLSILDISSIPEDPTGAGVKEVGWFDIYPESKSVQLCFVVMDSANSEVDDNSTGGGSIGFVGSWSSFGGFPSGHILINTIERGAFVVKVQNPLP